MGLNIRGGVFGKGLIASNFINIPTRDPYFKNTTLLLSGNGTNGANNRVFSDISTNNYGPLVVNGNVSEGSFTPFSELPGYWSTYMNFEGIVTYDYATVGSNFVLGANNFTIEMFIIPNTNATYLCSWGHTAGVGSAGLNIRTSGNSVSWDINHSGGTTSSNTSFTVSYTDWSHLALVRDGTTINMYHNGNLRSTGSITAGATITEYNNWYSIGILIYGSTIPRYGGYISNFRFGRGVEYSTNFTPITSPLGVTANTRLLCVRGPYPGKDYGPNNWSTLYRGTGNMVAYSPFDAPATINTNYVPYVITNTFTPSYHSGSLYFDGSGDYLEMTDNDSFNFGSGDFSVESWVYLTADPTTSYLVSQWGTSNKGIVLGIGAVTSKKMSFTWTTDGTTDQTITDANDFPFNQWTHVVACRSGSTISLFINGKREATSSAVGSGTLYNSTYAIKIGSHDSGTYPVKGYIYGLRSLSGNIYNAGATTITVPTEPTRAISGTKFLLSPSNIGIFDSTSLNTFETVGNAQISTAQSKWGGSSISVGLISAVQSYLRPAITGSNDKLAHLDFRTGDFTIEFWLYAASAGNAVIMDWRPASTNGLYPTILTSSTSIIFYTNSANRITATYSYAGVWTHVAVVRSSGVTRMYINGTQGGASYTDTNNYVITPEGRPIIGAAGTDLATTDIPFFIQDLRVTKWVARYTSNSSVVSSAFSPL